MNKEYKYDAFISYRHISPDKEIADKLQKMLESYNIPKQFRNNKKYKWHIFRDETELPTSGNLSSGIQEALETSNYLIVICSPSTQKSKWCMEEITKFKELHNGSNSKIITVLAGGTPDEVFPPELCTETFEELDKNGNTVYKERDIEPLAANVAAQSVKKSLKKLKSEFLRIAAPLLGCGYDALYKREHKKQVRKIITVSCTVIVAALAFLTYTGAMLFKINNQRMELAESNASLIEKTRLLQIENSKNLSRISEDIWLDGDGIGAVETLLPAFLSSDSQKSISPSALRVMADITGSFDIRGVKALLNIEHETPVKNLGFAGNGKTIVTQDGSGVYFWSAQSGKLIKKYGEELLGISVPNLYFENDGIIKTSAAKNHAGSTVMVQNDMILGYQKLFDDEVNLSGSDVYITSYNRALRIDGVSGEITAQITHSGASSAHFSKTDTGFVKTVSDYGSTEHIVEKYDEYGNLQGSYILKDFDFGYLSTGWLHFGDKKCYYKKYSSMSETLYAFDIEENEIKNPTVILENTDTIKGVKCIDGDLIVLSAKTENLINYNMGINIYNVETAELKYSYVFEKTEYSDISNIGKIYAENAGNYADIVFAAYGNKVILLNAANGELVKEFTYNGKITASYYSLDGFLYVITSEGYEVITPIRRIKAPLTDPMYVGKYQTDSLFGKHNICTYYNNLYAMCKEASKTVTIYTNSVNGDYTEIYFSDNETANDVFANPDGTYALIDNHRKLYVYSFASQAMRLIAEFDGYGMKCGFADNTTAFSLYKGKLSFYDLTSENSESVSFENEMYNSYKGITCKGELVFQNTDGAVLCNKNGKHEILTAQDISACLDDEYSYSRLQSVYIPENSEKLMLAVSCMDSVSYDTTRKLIAYDTGSKEFTYICDITDEHGSVKFFKSFSDGRHAVIFDDSTVIYFDSLTGKALDSVKYNLPLMVSFFPLDSNTAVILSNDSCLYKVDIAKKSIIAKLDISNDRIKTAYTDYSEFTYIPEKNLLILGGWSSVGYVIDMESFDLMYSIDYYEDYITSGDYVVTKQHGHIGYYPLYTMEELIEKATSYIGSN